MPPPSTARCDHQYRTARRDRRRARHRGRRRHRPSTWLSRDVAVWLTAGIGIVVVAALALLAGSAGITDLAPGAATIADGSLVVALLLGLAAGVSAMPGLTGGLVLALSAAYAARPGADEGSLVTASGRARSSSSVGSSASRSSGPCSGPWVRPSRCHRCWWPCSWSSWPSS